VAHADRERRALHRRLRTLCEDLDELLGQVGDAVRRDRAPEAARLLGLATVIATELDERLTPGASGQRPSPLHIVESVLDEEDVQRTLVLLEEFDAELDDMARGHGARQAAALAGGLVGEIAGLAGAAASGRTRPRTGPLRLVRSREGAGPGRPRRQRGADGAGVVRHRLWTNLSCPGAVEKW